MMLRRCFLVTVLGAAVLATAARAEPSAHEQGRIERLIRFVEAQKNMKFIRNGSEYNSTDAAKFLRGKLESMGDEVKTAREFIERIASKSSMSGEPYRVKFADGRLLLAAQFLGDELRRMDANPPRPAQR
jgi:Family of unknown function (DUF5329)